MDLARGLAVAMARDDVRLQVLEDMRDSPFPKHTIHLASYLQGERGRTVLDVVAGALDLEARDLGRSLQSVANLAAYVNPPKARTTWRGGPSIIVVPAYDGAVRDDALRGFRIGGEEVTVNIWTESPEPWLIVGPSVLSFGAEPEVKRAAAPVQSRSTISTIEETFSFHPIDGLDRNGPALVVCNPPGCDPCDELPTPPECEEPQPPPPPPGYYVPDTENCWFHVPMSPLVDLDWDGVLDDCEYKLAVAMAPQTKVSQLDGDWSKEPYWAAGNASFSGYPVVEVFYALAYHRDTGNWTGHPGDSEHVRVAALNTGPGYWSPYYVYTAAHWGTHADSGHLLGAAPFTFGPYPEYLWTTRPLAPVVWVSQDKHGSYPSRELCEAGLFGSDECPELTFISPVPILPDANLGSDYYHGPPMRDCVPSRTFYIGVECLWSDQKFEGWLNYPDGAGATVYSEMLRLAGPYS